jgi:hypothetical protein
VFEFEIFFYVSDARERTGGAKAFRDEARHQSSYSGFLHAANQSTSRASAALRFDLRDKSVAAKSHGAEQSGERFERSHAAQQCERSARTEKSQCTGHVCRLNTQPCSRRRYSQCMSNDMLVGEIETICRACAIGFRELYGLRFAQAGAAVLQHPEDCATAVSIAKSEQYSDLCRVDSTEEIMNVAD